MVPRQPLAQSEASLLIMGSSGDGGVLSECVQELRSSPHEYERVLGGSAVAVWRALGDSVERQLLQRRGVAVTGIGKFAFVRDVHPPAPIFLLADRFASAHGAYWRRPPPVLLTPTAELNMSAVGNDAGMPRDQVVQTIDAVWGSVGAKLRRGVACGRLPIAGVGAFQLDGKSVSFVFDPGFVKGLAHGCVARERKALHVTAPFAATKAAHQLREQVDVATTSTSVLTLPRALSLQLLPESPISSAASASGVRQGAVSLTIRATRDDSVQMCADQANATATQQSRHRHHHHHHLRHSKNDLTCAHRHTKSSGHLDAFVQDALQPNAATEEARSTAAPAQILPRFLIPERVRAPQRQCASMLDAAFARELAELQRDVAESERQDSEIARRTRATQLRYLQERAEKAIRQREQDAFLSQQMEIKRAEQAQHRAFQTSATDYDAVKVLPRDPVVSVAQRHEAKLKLRRRLHEQVALQDGLAHQKRVIDQAESAYFLSKLQQQSEQNEAERRARQRLDRAELIAGWKQQRAIQEQREQLRPTRIKKALDARSKSSPNK